MKIIVYKYKESGNVRRVDLRSRFESKTDEENAVKAIEYACGRRVGEPEYITNLFIQMATEQRSIDEESYTEEMRKLNEEWEENLAECKRQRDAYYDELTRLRQEKVELIDKACKWLYDWNQKQAKMYGAKGTLSITEYTINVYDFRKAMEE